MCMHCNTVDQNIILYCGVYIHTYNKILVLYRKIHKHSYAINQLKCYKLIAHLDIRFAESSLILLTTNYSISVCVFTNYFKQFLFAYPLSFLFYFKNKTKFMHLYTIHTRFIESLSKFIHLKQFNLLNMIFTIHLLEFT